LMGEFFFPLGNTAAVSSYSFNINQIPSKQQKMESNPIIFLE
jgi:hypothetical protein